MWHPQLHKDPEQQVPAVQMPAPLLLEQLSPAWTQRLSAQQPPAEQTLPSQHGWPGPPHNSQVSVTLEQPDPVAKQGVAPEMQHGPPSPPQAMQVETVKVVQPGTVREHLRSWPAHGEEKV